MKHGSNWYQREPTAYLGGVQGLTAREHAVYAIVLDLIYAHGGSVNNDPKWISGWISDMGAAAVRTTIASLVDRRKLVIDGDQLTQNRAKNQAKTREKLRENAQKNGKKGGKKSAEVRATTSKNNNIAEPPAASKNQADKTREDKSILDFLTEVCSREAVEDFIADRKERRMKITTRAAKIIANKLREHPDPDAVLRNSIANGWRGVFPEKITASKQEKRSGPDIAKRAAERWRQSRGLDSGPGEGAVVPLLPSGDRRRG